MKRDPALRELSVDHHHALVLARRATRVASGEVDACVADTWALVCESYERELEPHFVTEETLVLPQLAELGEDELVRRTLEDHRKIRAVVADTSGDLRGRLASFGQLLHDHVRFEERELFMRAQARLSAEQLAAVAKAGAHVAACKT